MATFGSDASASGGNPFAGSTSFAGGGNPFAGGGNPSAGGGNAPNFEGKWDFNYNWNFDNKESIVSQVSGSDGGAGQKPEAVPESVSSVSIVVLGCACLLWSRFKKVSHS